MSRRQIKSKTPDYIVSKTPDKYATVDPNEIRREREKLEGERNKLKGMAENS